MYPYALRVSSLVVQGICIDQYGAANKHRVQSRTIAVAANGTIGGPTFLLRACVRLRVVSLVWGVRLIVTHHRLA